MNLIFISINHKTFSKNLAQGPLASEGHPIILRAKIITQNKLLPNMCRAPEIFYAGRVINATKVGWL